MGSGHAHESTGNERALWWAFGLTFSFLIAEVVGGLLSGSLALISDAAHMFTDVMALGISLFLPMRVSEEDEVVGLDLSQHSETAYAFDDLASMDRIS